MYGCGEKPIEMTMTTLGAGGAAGAVPAGSGRTRYFDEHGELSREAMLLTEILATLKRIEAALTSDK